MRLVIWATPGRKWVRVWVFCPGMGMFVVEWVEGPSPWFDG